MRFANFARRFRLLGVLLVSLGAFGAPEAKAAEEILDFASRIEVRPDGNLFVNETIRVRAEGQSIKRGIYRDFPTLYKGPWFLRSSVPFRVVEVLRDGRPEPWHEARRSNGVRIYIGSENVFIPHGETTYTIRYETGRQLGFFDDYDELYWNVTGNGWDFPILHASACVNLPPGATVKSAEAYTGPQGARGSAWQTEPRSSCDVFFKTTQTLSPGEGLTIVVTWPKGFVTAPSAGDDFLALIEANRGLAFSTAGLLLTGLYFSIVWFLFGRDPERGTVIPEFAPPEGMTPQDLRYLCGLGTADQTSFAAAVLHLAVQGALGIHISSGGTYTLNRKKAQPSDPDERALLLKLFEKSQTLDLKNTNHQRVSAAHSELARLLKKKNARFFSANTHLWVVGLVLALIPLGISLLDANVPGAAIFMIVWLSIWSAGCAALVSGVVTALRGKKKWKAVPLMVFTLPFIAGWVFGVFMLLMSASPWVCVVFLCAIGMCQLFHHLLKQPTPEGQRLRDRIRGFRHYLQVAEAERLNLENPPERTPELFEKFLPHALALGVEQNWAEQFSGILEAAGYKPKWATGPGYPVGALTAGALASSLGSGFSSAVSSASSAPGSRSGSGGGGSSGGGGGGGGGGGW